MSSMMTPSTRNRYEIMARSMPTPRCSYVCLCFPQVASWGRTSVPFQRLLGVVKDTRRKALRHGGAIQNLDSAKETEGSTSKLARLAALNSTLSASDNMLANLTDGSSRFDVAALKALRPKFIECGGALPREAFYNVRTTVLAHVSDLADGCG